MARNVETVTVRGEQYAVLSSESVNLGGKFFGKLAFTLRKLSDGSEWSYCGKRITHNARLTATRPAPVAETVAPAADRCEHLATELGCELPTCSGAPVGELRHTGYVSDETTSGETGQASYGRDLARGLRRQGYSVTSVATLESVRGGRQATGYDLMINGHTVRVVMFESYAAGVMSQGYALWVDGVSVAVGGVRRPGAGALAYVVAMRLASTDVDVPPVVAPPVVVVAEPAAAPVPVEAAPVVVEAPAAVAAKPAAETAAPAAPMSATVDCGELADALAFTVKATPKRPTIPVMAGVLLTVAGGTLTVGAFDYEQSREVDVTADDAADGVALAGARTLHKLVSSLPRKSRVTLTVADPCTLAVVCGAAELSVPLMCAEDYPSLPAMPDMVGEVPARVFAGAVAAVAVAARRDENLPMMTGVRVEAAGGALDLLASDQYRIGIRRMPWAGADMAALVPAVTLAEVVKRLGKLSGPVRVCHDGNDRGGLFGLSAGPARVTVRTLDGVNYPPMRSLIPGPSKVAFTAVVEAAPLVAAVKRAKTAAVAVDGNKCAPVWLVCGPDGVRVAATPDATGEVVPGEWSGGELVMAFNPDYLAAGVTSAGADRVQFRAVDHDKPAVVVPVGDGVPAEDVHLIMPIRGAGNRSAVASDAETAAAAPVASGVVECPACRKPVRVTRAGAYRVHAAGVGVPRCSQSGERVPVAGAVSAAPVVEVAPVVAETVAGPVAVAEDDAPVIGAEKSADVAETVGETVAPVARVVSPPAALVTPRPGMWVLSGGGTFGTVQRAGRLARADGYWIIEGASLPRFADGHAVTAAVIGDTVCRSPRGACYCGLPHASAQVFAELPWLAEGDSAPVAETVAPVVEAVPADVAESGADIMARALAAYAAGNMAGARAAVADGVRLAPDCRGAGASGAVYGWAELAATLPADVADVTAVEGASVAPVAVAETVAEESAPVVAAPVAETAAVVEDDAPAETVAPAPVWVDGVRVHAVWAAGEVTVIRDARAGVCGPAEVESAGTRDDADRELAALGYTFAGPWVASRSGGAPCESRELFDRVAPVVCIPDPAPFTAPARAPRVPSADDLAALLSGRATEVPAEAVSAREGAPRTTPGVSAAVEGFAAVRAILAGTGGVPAPVVAEESAETVPAPVSVVPDTAAELVAGWDADRMPAPVSGPPAPVAETVPADGMSFTYAPGTRVRALLKDARRDILAASRAAGLGTARCSVVPDREARRVAVSWEGVAGADVARLAAIVSQVMTGAGMFEVVAAV